MATRCEICGKGPRAGKTYAHRGMAKAKGGVGIKVTGKTNRMIRPNVQVVRLRDPNGTVRTAHVCARCLRTGLGKGTLQKAGRRRHRWQPEKPEKPEGAEAAPVAPVAAAVAVEDAAEVPELEVIELPEEEAGPEEASGGDEQ